MNLNKIIKYLSKSIKEKPEIGIVLGSGLDFFSKSIQNKVIIPYEKIPTFFKTNVPGHKGEFIYGKINSTTVIIAKGRFHYYEGYNFNQVGSIIQILNSLNTKLCIITNSSGCLDTSWQIGSLMLSNKIIDFSFMQSSKHIIHNFKKTKYTQLAKEGAYVYTTGPSYETPAEIKKIITLNGKAVGMSTFPEYLKCIELNQQFLIISCLTNYGAGLKNTIVSHEDVLLNAKKYKKIFTQYILNIIQSIGLQKIQKK
jgi:purine-nucleoside phosphorylase